MLLLVVEDIGISSKLGFTGSLLPLIKASKLDLGGSGVVLPPKQEPNDGGLGVGFFSESALGLGGNEFETPLNCETDGLTEDDTISISSFGIGISLGLMVGKEG